ncbi:ASPRV1 [Cordylochernes scorpioides]|uniref:ASPRV1 n=1 Tax=Cordylochernes scorpioides TaxID=51811 RepID=A0ABY6LMF0_9ARAC|nr:ASPRV1 [Cordylochernes scorpioides]
MDYNVGGMDFHPNKKGGILRKTDEKVLRAIYRHRHKWVSTTFKSFRNPSIFTGEHNQNPEKWLKEYHRVARYNCWDDSMCLANVYFSSKKHRTDEKINSWDIFLKMFSQNFGLYVAQKDQLSEKLKTRAQGKEETSDSYIKDVLHLCRKVNPAMTEN